MNTRSRDETNRDETNRAGEPRDERREREWALQERAFDAERHGEAAGGDARLQRYRAVARALREPVVPALPLDFARRVAERASEESARAGQVEQRFAIALIALLAAAGLFYLGTGSGAALASVPAVTNSWVLALAACVGVSTLVQWWGGRRLNGGW